SDYLLADGRAALFQVCDPKTAFPGNKCERVDLLLDGPFADAVSTSGNEVFLLGKDGSLSRYIHYNEFWRPEDDPDPEETDIRASFYDVPELPEGVRYTALAKAREWEFEFDALLLARSDGKVDIVHNCYSGFDYPYLKDGIPPAPSGLHYVQIATTGNLQASVMLLRNDGKVVGMRETTGDYKPFPDTVTVPNLKRGWVFTNIWPGFKGYFFGAAKSRPVTITLKVKPKG
ncbi:MAG: hypothetical protein LBQ92_00960, partial [Propionibacteriaceae bacterium]|nr:hypothetical protein [Propionibacteriaceae bacterium]